MGVEGVVKIKTLSVVVPVVALAALSLGVVPANAGQRGRHAPSSHSAPQGAPAPRAVPMQRGPAAPVAPRNLAPPRSLPPPQSTWRGDVGRAQPRGIAPQSTWRGDVGRVQPRGIAPQSSWRGDVGRVQPRGIAPQSTWRGDLGRVSPRGIAPRGVAVPRPFPIIPRSHFVRFAPLYRPYYSFRPRFRLSFGLFVGYPVIYPTYWYDPGWYYAPPVSVDGYGYGDYGVSAAPEAAYGGISFDITPSNAAVFVDGTYVGTVADFSATNPPLTMAVGTHHIEIRAQGYQTLAFDADVNSREVVPYQGTMQLIR